LRRWAKESKATVDEAAEFFFFSIDFSQHDDGTKQTTEEHSIFSLRPSQLDHFDWIHFTGLDLSTCRYTGKIMNEKG